MYVTESRFYPQIVEILLYNHVDRGVYQFEIGINALINTFRFIWIPVLCTNVCVYDYYK